jgi:hypothetical protein
MKVQNTERDDDKKNEGAPISNYWWSVSGAAVCDDDDVKELVGFLAVNSEGADG